MLSKRHVAYLSVFYSVIVLLVSVAAGRRGHIAAVETAERTLEWGADGRRFNSRQKSVLTSTTYTVQSGRLKGDIYEV